METRHFQDEMLRLHNKSNREVRQITQHPDVLTKARVASLEVQLNAACAARNDALREVERLTEKFEAASNAVHEVFHRDPHFCTKVLWRSFQNKAPMLIVSKPNVYVG